VTRHAVVHYPGRQQPPASRVVYWCERINGWWPGLGRSCPHCGGRLDADPPDAVTVGPGRVYCLDCSREWATVRDRPPRELTEAERASFANAPRGRPPGRQSAAALRAQRERRAAERRAAS
jgi:hypothetical protein